MSDIKMGTLYQMNQGVILASEQPLTRVQIKEAMKKINQFFYSFKDNYFMLLCREKYDFTLFNLKYKETFSMHRLLLDLEECLENRGEVLSIEKTKDKSAFEIWIKIDGQAFVYYLFPYDIGVIEEV